MSNVVTKLLGDKRGKVMETRADALARDDRIVDPEIKHCLC